MLGRDKYYVLLNVVENCETGYCMYCIEAADVSACHAACVLMCTCVLYSIMLN